MSARKTPCEIEFVLDVIVDSGLISFLDLKSKKASKTVWIAIPPKILPSAIEGSPCRVPLITIATSGKFTMTESSIVPPNAAPNLYSSLIKSTIWI